MRELKFALDALWSQIDFANSLWQIPAQMMKTARPHRVFLSQSVKNMLINCRENLPFKSDFIFARARNLKREIDTNFALNITSHGFYGTFLTIAHERHNEHKISSDVIKMRLLHSQDEGAKGVYNHAQI